MAKFTPPITNENFDLAFDFINKKRVSSERKELIKKIVYPLGSALFVVLSFLLIYGVFYTISDVEEMVVFESLGFVTKLWNNFSSLFLSPESPWYISWLLGIVLTYFIPFAVSAIIAIIVTLAYKGSSVTKSTENTANKAKQLYEIAARANKNATYYFDNDKAKTICRWIFVILLTAFLGYSLFGFGFSEFEPSMLIGYLIVIAVVYFLYGLLFNLFSFFNALLFKIKPMHSLVKDADDYWLKNDPAEKARRKAESERRAKEAAEAKENAAKNRIRALELEKRGEYAEAKRLFRLAAGAGDSLGMYNYARFCYIDGNRSDAIYWLQKAVDTGETDDEPKEILKALKEGKSVDAHYC